MGVSGARTLRAALAGGAMLALQACGQPPAPTKQPKSSPPQAATPCDAAAARFALGQQPLPALLNTARRQAGATTVRAIGHDELVTKEYLPTRLNLQLDAQGKVARVYCG